MNIESSETASVSQSSALLRDWIIFATEAGAESQPSNQFEEKYKVYRGVVPGTVAMAVNGREPECWSTDFDYDDKDWWYQTNFDFNSDLSGQTVSLVFHGLATLCDIWLNGQKLLSTNNMFRGYRIDITEILQASNHLVLSFRSIKHQLAQGKRARPKWKTKLAGDQQMRWIRTSLLGYINAWTPPVKCIGPWRDIEVLVSRGFTRNKLRIVPTYNNSQASLTVAGEFTPMNGSSSIISSWVEIAGQKLPLDVKQKLNLFEITGELVVEQVEPWWPHTHGKQPLYACRIAIETEESTLYFESDKVGFKAVDFNAEKSQLTINQQTVFCRGVSWTTSDFLSLNGGNGKLDRQLSLLRNAGVNMIRIGGTMIYESDYFYKQCDQLGILVWQDFMFASMDYPTDDADFLSNASAEVDYQLNRLCQHVCIATYCGNTDVKAQAAMFGFPREQWSNAFFDQIIPELVALTHPGIPYHVSSPDGGALPFHLATGITHYWGVSTYLRPINDPNIARVKFASECLGQSHLPIDDSISDWIGKNRQPVFDAEWLSRIPKDLGAGWSFEQVLDFYINALFSLDPVRLRRSNPQRYLYIARVTTGEILAKVFRQWRRESSSCNGGIVWFARDFWPGAGFGIIDSFDRPKPAYYFLKRVWAQRTLLLNSDGLDGSSVTLVNDGQVPLNGSLEVSLYNEIGGLNKRVVAPVELAPFTTSDYSVDALLQSFYDTAYDYQIGEPAFDILACRLLDKNGTEIGDDYFFSRGYTRNYLVDPDISYQIKHLSENEFELTILSNQFLQYVNVSIKDFEACDNYFHILPNIEKTLQLTRINPSVRSLRGQLSALNLANSILIK